MQTRSVGPVEEDPIQQETQEQQRMEPIPAIEAEDIPTAETGIDTESIPIRPEDIPEETQRILAQAAHYRELAAAAKSLKEAKDAYEAIKRQQERWTTLSDDPSSSSSESDKSGFSSDSSLRRPQNRRQKGEIKRHVDTFKEHFSISQRETWISDLEDLFLGAPNKYISDKQKVLAATNFLCAKYRNKWKVHREQQPESARNWGLFTTWTLSLLDNAFNLKSEIISNLEAAKQRDHQSPMEFLSYLESLEKHLPTEKEETLAYRLFGKFQKSLRDRIIENQKGSKLPKTRNEMSKIAETLWHVSHQGKSGEKRKQTDADSESRYTLTKQKGFRNNFRNHHNERTSRPQNDIEIKGKADQTRRDTKNKPFDKRNWPKSGMKCAKCNRTNHETKDCFAKTKVQEITSQRNTNKSGKVEETE